MKTEKPKQNRLSQLLSIPASCPSAPSGYIVPSVKVVLKTILRFYMGFLKLPAISKARKFTGKLICQEDFQNLDTRSVKIAIKSISVIHLALYK